MLNYRRADLTLACVQSLVGQVPYILIVDNSADANHWQELIEVLARISQSDRAVTTIEHISADGNLGFAQGVQLGLNHLVKLRQWKAFLIINNDAVAGPDMLKQLLTTFDKYGGHALVAPESCSEGSPTVRWYHRTLALVLRKRVPGSFKYLNGACFLAPVAVTQPFLFDPDFFMYGEDVELSWRLTRSGIPLLTSPCSYSHIGSASSKVGSEFYEIQTVRGHCLLGRKLSRNRADFILLFIGRCISLPIRAFFRCLRTSSILPLIAMMRALRHEASISQAIT